MMFAEATLWRPRSMRSVPFSMGVRGFSGIPASRELGGGGRDEGRWKHGSRWSNTRKRFRRFWCNGKTGHSIETNVAWHGSA